MGLKSPNFPGNAYLLLEVFNAKIMEELPENPVIPTAEVLKNIGAALYVFDMATSKLRWINNVLSDISGYDESDPVFSEMEIEKKHYHPADRNLIKARIDFFRKRKGEFWTGVYRISHKNGNWVWVYSKVSVFKCDYSGKAISLIGLLIDVNTLPNTEIQFDSLFRERMRIRNYQRIKLLTNREREIIPLIAKGLSYTEIADKLMIQPDTVNRHRKNILKKLDLTSIATLAFFASENGLIGN